MINVIIATAILTSKALTIMGIAALIGAVIEN